MKINKEITKFTLKKTFDLLTSPSFKKTKQTTDYLKSGSHPLQLESIIIYQHHFVQNLFFIISMLAKIHIQVTSSIRKKLMAHDPSRF